MTHKRKQNRLRRRMLAGQLLLMVLMVGCLDPLVDEEVGYSAALQPEGADIASIEDDDVAANRLANNVNVADMVPVRSAFADGRKVSYWDFGAGSRSVEPLWTFWRESDDGDEVQLDHLDLIDSVPGDDNYSSLRQIFKVYVTDGYAGERITSLRALEDAVELGLVLEPEATESYVDRPVVPKAVRLPSPDAEGAAAPEPVYYRGRVATHFRIGGNDERVFELGRGRVGTPNVYALRRQHQSSVLDEAEWDDDLDGDGDKDDSNLVFAFDASAPGYTGLWLRVEVTVPESYAFGDSKAEADLFEQTDAGPQARTNAVVTFEDSSDVQHLILFGDNDEEGAMEDEAVEEQSNE